MKASDWVLALATVLFCTHAGQAACRCNAVCTWNDDDGVEQHTTVRFSRASAGLCSFNAQGVCVDETHNSGVRSQGQVIRCDPETKTKEKGAPVSAHPPAPQYDPARALREVQAMNERDRALDRDPRSGCVPKTSEQVAASLPEKSRAAYARMGSFVVQLEGCKVAADRTACERIWRGDSANPVFVCHWLEPQASAQTDRRTKKITTSSPERARGSGGDRAENPDKR